MGRRLGGRIRETPPGGSDVPRLGNPSHRCCELKDVPIRQMRMRDRVPAVDSIDRFGMFILNDAAERAREAGRDVILLTLGKSDLAPHPSIADAITAAINDPVKSSGVFPRGLPGLRNALATRYSERANITVSPDRILIDAGTSALYPTLLRVLTAGEGEVLLPRPYYPLYRVAAALAGATVAYYDVSLDTLEIDIDSCAAAISERTKAVVLNTPGNPLGNVVTVRHLNALIDRLPDDTFIVLDEIYENTLFGNDRPLAPILLERDGEAGCRVVVTNSFSKAYRMYCRRVGWCVLPARLITPLAAVIEHTRLTIDPCLQYGALEALRRDDDVRQVSAVHRNRWQGARCALSDLPGVELLPSSGGFYCTLLCREFIATHGFQTDLALAADILEEVGVATVPCSDFGLPHALRLSFTAQRFGEAVLRLKQYFLAKKSDS